MVRDSRNRDDVTETISEYEPKVLCVQETNSNSRKVNFLWQYAIFSKDREDAVHSSGGWQLLSTGLSLANI